MRTIVPHTLRPNLPFPLIVSNSINLPIITHLISSLPQSSIQTKPTPPTPQPYTTISAHPPPQICTTCRPRPLTRITIGLYPTLVKALRAHGVREGTALLSVTLAPDDGGVDVDVEILEDGDVEYGGEEGVVGGRCQDGDEGEEGDVEKLRREDEVPEETDAKINTLFKRLHCNRASNASNAGFELEGTRPRDEMHDNVDFPVDQNEREDDRRDSVLPTALQPLHLGDELDALVLDDEDRRLVEGWRGPWILNNEEEEEVDMEGEILEWGYAEYNTLFAWIQQARREGWDHDEDGEEKKDWDWDEEDEDEEWDENEVVIEDYDEDEDEDEDEEDEDESWDENEAIIEDYDEDDESELEPACENAFQGDSRGNLLVQNKRPNVAQEFDGDRGLVEWRCQGVIAEESQKAHLSTAERSGDEQRLSLAQKLEILDSIAKNWVLAQLWRGERVYVERQGFGDKGDEKEDEAEDEVVFRGRRRVVTP